MIIQFKVLQEKSKRYKELVAIIPFILTFLNAFFGFISIIKSLEADYTGAALYILLAACMDACDGRVARALGVASCIGMELDSLCDAISFCLAPSILLYSWYPEPLIGGQYILGLYLCAGLWRLARYNSSPQQQNYFIGLPTTIAAIFVASIVLHEPWILVHPTKVLLYKKVMLFLIGFIAFLMLSPLRFPSLKQFTFSFSKDFFKISCTVITILICLIRGYPFFFFIIGGYLVLSIVYSTQLILKKSS